MTELRRVILSKIAIWTLVILLIINGAEFVVTAKNDANGDITYYKQLYLDTLEEYRNTTYEEALEELTDKKNFIAAQSEYYLFYCSVDGGITPSEKELFVGIYGENMLNRIVNADVPTTEQLDRTAIQIKVYTDVLEQLFYVKEDYEQYISDITENYKQITSSSLLFIPNSFSARNAEKTLSDFAKLNNIEITLDNDLAIKAIFNNNFSECCVIIYVVVIALLLVEERKGRMWELVHSTVNGRIYIAIYRIGVMFVAAVLSVTLLLGERLLLAAICYDGIGDPLRDIHSISLFRYITHEQTVSGYLLSSFFFKISGAWLIGLLLWFMLSMLSNINLSIAVSVLIIGLEYILFMLIPDSFSIVIFRFVNIFAYIDYQRIFLPYLNINLFGFPVRGSLITLCSLPVLLIVSFCANIVLSIKKRNLREMSWIAAVREKVMALPENALSVTHRAFTEVYKLFRIQRAFPIIIIMIIWALFIAEAPQNYCSLNSTQAYCRLQIEGSVSPEMLNKLNDQIELLEQSELQTEIQSRQKMVYEELYNIADEYLKQETAEKEYWIIDSTMYDSLLNPRNTKAGFAAVLFTILLTAGVFSVEKQHKTKDLLNATPYGGKYIFKTKLLTAFAVTVFVFLFVYGVEILLTFRKFGGLHSLSAPVSSLTDLYMDSQLAIGHWLILTYANRLLILLEIEAGIMLISSMFFDQIKSLVICTVTLLIPSALSLIDDGLLKGLSPVSQLAVSGINATLSTLVLSLIACLLLLVLVYNSWTVKDSRIFLLANKYLSTQKINPTCRITH